LSKASMTARELENMGKLHQMKLNTRLVALERATMVCSAANYAGKNSAIEVMAVATEFEGYILGQIEQETKEAFEAAQANINGPRIVRP